MALITINEETKEYKAGTTFEEIANDYQSEYGNTIALVVENGKIRELFKKVSKARIPSPIEIIKSFLLILIAALRVAQNSSGIPSPILCRQCHITRSTITRGSTRRVPDNNSRKTLLTASVAYAEPSAA